LFACGKFFATDYTDFHGLAMPAAKLPAADAQISVKEQICENPCNPWLTPFLPQAVYLRICGKQIL